jgi:hypothetical protein
MANSLRVEAFCYPAHSFGTETDAVSCKIMQGKVNQSIVAQILDWELLQAPAGYRSKPDLYFEDPSK